MEETVSLCCSSQAWHSWLVWNILKVKIKMIFQHKDIPMLAVPDVSWQDVEQLDTLHS